MIATIAASGLEVKAGLDRAEWNAVLKGMAPACRDVYFTPGYHSLHEANGDGEPFAGVVRQGPKALLITGLRSVICETGQLVNDVWDLQSCNGYGGPVASASADSGFREQAWKAWKRECQSAGMVAAFFRLHPLLDNAEFLATDAKVRADRKTVFVDLSEGIGKQWQSADSRHRNMVNKGSREKVAVRWNEPSDWDAFAELYSSAMQRVSAPGRLQFSAAYFEKLRGLPGAELGAVRQGTSLVSGAVFLFSEVWGHYHLSARAAGSQNHLTNCILQSAFQRAAGCGLQGVHLGGGRTSAPEDTLLKFKVSTGGKLLDFKVALVIVNQAEYEALCDQWQRQTGFRSDWLLEYRQRYGDAVPQKEKQ